METIKRSIKLPDHKTKKLGRIDKSRLAIECDKLNPIEEKELSEEGIGS